MSYSITVHVKAGKASVEHSGTIPDGTFVLYGHHEHDYEDLTVARHDAEPEKVNHGKPAAQASTRAVRHHPVH